MLRRPHAPLLLTLLALLLAAPSAMAGERALWLRDPAISPDGNTIAFSYRGDIYRVPSEGGVATPLTIHEAHESHPEWSPDGELIAFASDRYGNDDVFVMPAAGGRATRLTFHSSSDVPSAFTPEGESVVFEAARLDTASSVQFPTRAQPELYTVSIEGGMPVQVLTTPAINARWDRAAERLVYNDEKGYEGEWRKHDDSSFARDVWVYDAASGEHTKLTPFGHDDREPVFAPGEEAIFFLSERSGSFNVWRMVIDRPGSAQQITTHDTHPVRFLSASDAGDLAYAYDGEIWVRPAGASESRKLDIRVATDLRYNEVELVDVARNVSEIAVSPSGEELAFVARGEIYVTSSDYATTRRITDTPEQERSVSFSPDGRSLLYAGEREGSWNIYRTTLSDEEEPHFFNATAMSEETLLADDEETFEPRFSPDGSEVAYLRSRTQLEVLKLETKERRVVLPGSLNYSYTDGDQWFEWSPDGRWFAVQMLDPTRYSLDAVLVPSSGEGEKINVSKSGYWAFRPHFAMDGEVLIWASDRHGERAHGGWGGESDVYAAFLTQKSWDRFNLSEAEFEQLKEREKKEEKDEKAKKKGDDDEGEEKKSDKKKRAKDEEEAADDEKKAELPEPIELDLEGLDDRRVRLTLHSSDLADAVLTPDGEALIYLARFERGYDIWKYEPRKREVKLLAKLNANRAGGFEMDKEGKKLFFVADQRVHALDIASGKVEPVGFSATMELDAEAERAYFFEHAWRQTREKFYVEDLHGVDWELYKSAYARFLPHIDNGRDFAELISEMQGELNASHMGGRYRPGREGGDATASLGFFPDPSHEGPGVKILEIMQGGPLVRHDSGIREGQVILAIDGHEIAAGENWYPLLNRKAGERVRLRVRDGEETFEERVKPISQGEKGQLLYRRWVRGRRAAVEELSGGRLGYAHIRGMSDGPYREVFEEVFGLHADAEGLILDTRFNGGGNLVEALTIFLTGETYGRMVPRGQEVGTSPRNRWTKPSIVVMNEGNYSDAHCFPAAYTSLGIGETVGMQVPGTCTAVWWERLHDGETIFGIPQIGYIDNEGDMLENKHLDPDHVVDNDPKLEAAGRDQQLERAVEVLLEDVSAAKP